MTIVCRGYNKKNDNIVYEIYDKRIEKESFVGEFNLDIGCEKSITIKSLFIVSMYRSRMHEIFEHIFNYIKNTYQAIKKINIRILFQPDSFYKTICDENLIKEFDCKHIFSYMKCNITDDELRNDIILDKYEYKKYTVHTLQFKDGKFYSPTLKQKIVDMNLFIKAESDYYKENFKYESPYVITSDDEYNYYASYYGSLKKIISTFNYKDPRYYFIYDEDNNTIKGFLRMHMGAHYKHIITGLYISPEYRNEGVGSELIRCAMYSCNDFIDAYSFGFERLYVDVYAENKDAFNLYLDNNFIEERRILQKTM